MIYIIHKPACLMKVYSSILATSQHHYHQITLHDTFTFTFSRLADAFIQSDLQLGST